MRVELDVGQPVVLPAGEGIKALGDHLTVAEREGDHSTTPHIHRAHADGFYVLGGEFAFADATLPPGGFGLAPAGVVHWFAAKGARYVNIHAPGKAWTNRLRGRTDEEEIDSFDPPADASGGPLVVLPGEGEAFEGANHAIRIKAALPELCLFEFDVGPGWNGPRAHLHRQHVDAFYVLDGALAFELGGEQQLAEQGAFVAAPPGVAHTFRSAGEGRVRFLNLHAPGLRFDEYLRRSHAGEHGRRFLESFDVYEAEAG